MGKILHPEPGARRRTLRALMVVGAAGTAVVAWITARLQYLQSSPAPSSPVSGPGIGAVYEALIGSAVLAACVAAFAVLQRSVLALQSGEFPPPGTRVLHDTAVFTGPAARRLAAVGIVLGALLVGCAAVLLVLLVRLERCIGRLA